MTEGILVRRERKRAVDLLTVTGLAVMFIALAVPWFVHALDRDIAPPAWSAFLMSIAYLAIAILIDQFGNRTLVTIALYAAPFIAVTLYALQWHFCGGNTQPALLAVFSLAVIAAAYVGAAWVPYAVAAAATMAAAIASIMETPSLGWYITQSGLPVGWLIRMIPARAPGLEVLEVAPAQLFATLLAFAIGMFAVAFASRRMIRFVEREVNVRALPEQRKPFLDMAFHSTPIPTVVVTRTAQIIAATDSFAKQMLLPQAPGQGQELFDVLKFEEPDRVLSLITSGHEIEFMRYRIGRESRIASLDAERFRSDRDEFCVLTIRDWDRLGYVALAAEGMDRPLMLVGSEDQRLRYANPAAAAIVGEIYVGRDMRWLAAEEGALAQRFEITRIPLRLADSEAATLVAFVPRKTA
ncbi:MAG: hypothetical protein M3041_21290 [Acidobacteriota bacterium]|nr:hypothetical protein [Acidobacteriota bacterium]